MSQQPSRKPQHQQQSPPAVKEEQQEQEEESTHSIGAGNNGNGNHCSSSSNFENSNNTIGSAGGNGGDDINQLKLKMAALEAKNLILESRCRLEYQMLELERKWENQKLNARRIHAMDKTMMDEFGQRLTTLEAKYQQEIAKLKAIIERNQQKIAEMRDYVVVNMPESQETSNNLDGIQHKPKSVASNLVPCHSANLPDCVNIQESHENLNTLDERLRALEGRKKARLAAFAALIPPPPKSVHSAQQEETKRLCNPLENCWKSKSCKATMKVQPDALTAHNSSQVDWGNLIAEKGLLVSDEGHKLQQDNFAGPILYYYEITAKSSLVMTNEGRLLIGFSPVPIKNKSWIGHTPNTYAMQDEKPDYCFLSGEIHYFNWPDGGIKPILRGRGDVFGCGFVLSADNKLAIFFTTNGILMGKQIPIVYSDSILYPTVQLNRNITVEANFGQKQFKYNINECPGLQLQW